MSDKSEEPTPRRLRKARDDGDVAVSGALLQGGAFVVAMALAPAAIGALGSRAAFLLRRAIGGAPDPTPLDLARDTITLTVPLVAGAAVTAFALGFVQSGGVLSAKKIFPDGTRLNPATGLKNLVSGQRLWSIARALIAALVVGWLAVQLLMVHAGSLANATGEPNAGIGAASVLVKRLGWIAALVGLALGGVDFLVSRRSWLSRLRMSKDEVKREHKESEGDPEIKAARKRAHQEMLAGATLSAVRQATVVIVNPTHLATALEYREDEEHAPRVVAQGQGDLAQKMVQAARALGIPVIRDVPVARALSELEVGDEIPEALYEAVAEILREAWEELETP